MIMVERSPIILIENDAENSWESLLSLVWNRARLVSLSPATPGKVDLADRPW